MRPLQQLSIALGMYAAFLVDVALRACTGTEWLPSAVLLAASMVGRNRGGIFWATMAGLLCDGLAGRPLGVTMLVAALATTVLREASPTRVSNGLWRVAQAFAFVAVIEFGARLLANTVVSRPEDVELLMNAFAIATTSSLVMAVWTLATSLVTRLLGGSVRRASAARTIPLFR
ncbi:MAG: hypothetical protein M3552_09530 [Planctomycetota bacterium]|nr:hypothetical protein [Planctomycetaceae bacterium]MDQ3330880.1 hypothetical protein [Planctomycetota bacterium]